MLWTWQIAGHTSKLLTSQTYVCCVCAADPVNLAVGQPVGGLGLMMHNRRRNRVNSTVARREGSCVTLHVDQSFGNCPKYIQV